MQVWKYFCKILLIDAKLNQLKYLETQLQQSPCKRAQFHVQLTTTPNRIIYFLLLSKQISPSEQSLQKGAAWKNSSWMDYFVFIFYKEI